MMKTLNRYLIPLILLLFSTSCGPTPNAVNFDPKPFANQNYNLVLCLDLQQDLSPSAGLLVNPYPKPTPTVGPNPVASPSTSVTASSSPDVSGGASPSSTVSPSVVPTSTPIPSSTPSIQRFVVLPFESVQAQSNEDIVSTWGSYRQFTLISYFPSERMGYGNGIGIAPRIPIYTSDEVAAKESFGEPVYIITSGETRTLVFKFLPADKQSSLLPPHLQHLPFDSFDAIAVKLPNDAAQVAGSYFINESPTHESEKSDLRIRYYVGNPARASVPKLQLSYVIKPNSVQSLFVEYALKILGVLFVPGLTLYFLRREGTTSPEKRKQFLWVLGTIQALIVIGVVVYYVVFGVSESQVKATLDTVLVLGGGVVSQAVVLLTAKEKKA